MPGYYRYEATRAWLLRKAKEELSEARREMAKSLANVKVYKARMKDPLWNTFEEGDPRSGGWDWKIEEHKRAARKFRKLVAELEAVVKELSV